MASDSNVSLDGLALEDPPPPKPKKVYKYPGYRKCDPVDRPLIAVSRHSFGAPLKFQKPNPNDMVYWEALRVVKEYQKDPTFHNFANPLHLSALNCAPTIFFRHYETEPVVHALTREQCVVKLQLKLISDLEYGWSSCTVLVRDGDRWILLREFLKTLANYECVYTSQASYRIQHRWWMSMGKPFRLMDLPVELRELILLKSLGEQVSPTVEYDSGITRITRGAPTMGYYAQEGVPATNISMLLLNKDLRAVTTELLWNSTTKVFYGLRTLNEVCKPLIPFTLHYIRRLQLALPPLTLWTLFRVQVSPFEWDDSTTNVIQNLPSLSFLEIQFSKDPRSSPWYYSAIDRPGWTGEPWDVDWEALGLEFERPPCQRILVDMTMSFAAPYLRHIETVRLTGLVKTCSKKKWESLLNKTAFAENAAMIEGWKKEFSGLKAHDLPPRCVCVSQCSHSTCDFDYDDVGGNGK